MLIVLATELLNTGAGKENCKKSKIDKVASGRSSFHLSGGISRVCDIAGMMCDFLSWTGCVPVNVWL